MFRLLGFCLGSVLAVAVLIALVGVPIVHTGDTPTDADRFNAAVEKLKAKQSAPPPLPTGKPLADSPVNEESVDDVPADLAADSETAIAEELQAQVSDAHEREAAVASSASPGDHSPGPVDAPAKEWYEFWTPFRSKIAAAGFMHRLEAVTGLDYRVVEKESGDYQVMFAYAGENELNLKLERISAATGLDLSGGTL